MPPTEKQIRYVEPELSIVDLAQLVFVAHETANYEIRKAALALLDRALNPIVIRMEESAIAVKEN